ncbi:autotransporter domain-containing protein [Phyllobacterium sp. K27]
MNFSKKLGLVSHAAIIAAGLIATPAIGQNLDNKAFAFKNVIVFGDSLSDIGALKPPADLVMQNLTKLDQTLTDVSSLIKSPSQFDLGKWSTYFKEIKHFAYPPYTVPKEFIKDFSSGFPIETRTAAVAQLESYKKHLSELADLVKHIPHGRFSNGPVWNQYLVGEQAIATAYPDNIDRFMSRVTIEFLRDWFRYPLLQAIFIPAKATGHLWEYTKPPADGRSMNYAVGGARYARTGDTHAKFLIPGLSDQLGGFDGTKISKDTLVAVWLGANDVFTILNPDSNADPQAIVKELKKNMTDGLEKIYGAGGRNLLVPNVPDVSLTPEHKNNAKEAAAATKLVNDAIASVVADFKAKHPGDELNVYTPDMTTVLDIVIRHPAAFGIANTTDQCISVDACRQYPKPVESGNLFWDQVHPTTRAHGYIAKYFTTFWQNPALAGSYFSSPTGFYDTTRHYFSPKSDLVFSGGLHGNNAMYKLNGGTLTLTGDNSYNGGTFLEAGTLQIGDGGETGSIVGNVVTSANTDLGFDRSDVYTFAGSISGEGNVAQLGTGTTILTGESTYTGQTKIAKGGLAVDGSLTSTVVVNTGLLTGTGKIGGLQANSGSFVSPGIGQSVGTLTVANDATFEKGSVYNVNIANNLRTADRLEIGGKATLQGGSVQLRMEGNPELLSADEVETLFLQNYNILHAKGGLSGTGRFDNVVPQFNYITPSLVYDSQSVSVAFDATKTTLNRMMAIEAPLHATTINQKSAWGGFKSFGTKNPLFNTVLFSTKDKPLNYDTLTGEAHASLAGVLISDGQLIGDAASSRVRSAFNGISAKGQSAQIVSAAPLAYVSEGKTKTHEAFALVEPQATTTLWGQGYGSWARLDGNGNASSVSSKSGGLVTGFDGIIDDDLFGTQWRAGLLAGYGNSSVSTAYGKAGIDSYQMGVYGGANWDALGLRFGVNLAHHEIETERDAHFGNIHGEHQAEYGANSIQVFGELGYTFKPAQGLAIEPFAGLRYASIKTDAFEESGTISQLSALANRTERTSSTVGLRASYQFELGGNVLATARGTVGWNHGFGDLTPKQRLSFAGAAPFTVEGLPTARNAAFVEAGLDFNIGKRTTLGLTYSGQFSQSSRANGVNADIAVRF